MAEWKLGFSLCKQRNKLEKGELKILRKFAVTGDVRGSNAWLPASPPLVSHFRRGALRAVLPARVSLVTTRCIYLKGKAW